MSGVKCPLVAVQLSECDGNAFAIIARVRRAMQRVGVSRADQDTYLEEATRGDYDNLLSVTQRWVNVK